MSEEKYLNDHFTKEARRRGFRARSVFKLEEIDQKYSLFKKKNAVLDLGAAPGSFLQYISKKVGKDGVIVGIDLSAIEPFQEKNIHIIVGDIEEVKSNPEICTTFLPAHKSFFDVVTADLAPKTSGDKELDHYRSMELNRLVFDIARQVLKPGGFIVSKMFEGEEMPQLIKEYSAHFSKIKMNKPRASHRSRNEVFYVGKRK